MRGTGEQGNRDGMKNKYLKHFLTVYRHRKIVRKECFLCGLWWQGITHDLSKYSFAEFASSARYFQGDRSPIEAQKEDQGYSEAWLHHKGHNKHHWEYWTDFDDEGNVIPLKIPYRYVIEMVCDYIGAGKVYSSKKWTQEEPLDYFIKVRKGRHFHEETESLILYLLSGLAIGGETTFHSQAKSLKEIYDKGRFKEVAE